MVHNCCLCKTRWSKDENLSFHKFPKDPQRKEEWLKSINKLNVSNSAMICSRHFDQTSYIEPIVGSKRFLKPDTVPTLIINNMNIKTESSHVSENNQVNLGISSTSNIETSSAMILDNRRKRKCSDDNEWKNESNTDFLNYKKITDVNWDKISYSPEKMRLCWDVAVETIKEQKKEIRYLKRILRNYEAAKRIPRNNTASMQNQQNNNPLSNHEENNVEISRNIILDHDYALNNEIDNAKTT